MVKREKNEMNVLNISIKIKNYLKNRKLNLLTHGLNNSHVKCTIKKNFCFLRIYIFLAEIVQTEVLTENV